MHIFPKRVTVKTVVFVCPLFHDFGDLAKIADREYSKSHHLLVHLLQNPTKMPKLRGPK